MNDLARVHVWPWLFNPGFWSAVVLALVVAVLLRRTVFGRYVYAVGSNEATARLCGVPVRRVKLWVYMLAGLLAGWAMEVRLYRRNEPPPKGRSESNYRLSIVNAKYRPAGRSCSLRST